ncbi:MAG: FRG domain-containing protein [Nitrospiria bacterium]
MSSPKPKATREMTVHSWNELQEQLFDESWRPELNRFRSHDAFRGLSDARYRLETTLVRLGGRPDELERHLLRNFRKYAHRDVVEGDSVWHWLSVAKHHGLPTRLLDWTFSPYVAMHFATADSAKFHMDGVIWAVNYAQAHATLPERLQAALKQEGSDVFTVEMLSETIASLGDLDTLSPEDFLMFFEPPSMDDRIVNQFALFSILSNPKAVFEDWLTHHPQLVRKIVIPAKLKWEIRDKLDQANITERVLFPGLDGLSSWLRRHYSSKP